MKMMMKISNKSLRVNQCGTSMLEVLVSIVVVALGLLGFAGLQTLSIKSNNTAYYRSQATMLAYDMIDRMRANKALALASSYDMAENNIPASAGGTVLENDKYEWKTNIASSLPGGKGSVSVDLNRKITITLKWDDDGDGTDTIFSTTTNF